MQSKITLKIQAVKLRKQGSTYSEILKEIPVAKSTLSIWLKEVGLAKSQVQRITEKRIQAALRGAYARREYRIKRTEEIHKEAASEISNINSRELWLIATALYWAEGSKEKEGLNSRVIFSNSDPQMIKLFIKWLVEGLKINPTEIHFEIYIHRIYESRILEIKNFWSKSTNFNISKFSKVYYKQHNIKTIRKNVGNMYNGVLRVVVCRSSNLNRKIAGWVRQIAYLTN